MKKIKLITWAIASSMLLLLSCSNDDPTPTENKEVVKLPVKITFTGDESAHNFEYDTNDRITKLVCTKVGGENKIFNFTYDGAGKLVKITDDRGFVHSFEYSDHKITETVMDNDTYDYSVFYKLNEKEQVTEYSFDENDATPFICSYDNKGNLLKHSYISGSNNDEEYGLENLVYDTKKGMMSQVKSPSWVYFIIGDLEFEFSYLVNNTLKQRLTYDGYTYNFVYGYDEEGYPVTMTEEEQISPEVLIEYKTVE